MAEIQSDPTIFARFDKARRAVYLPSSRLSCTMNAYLDMLDDERFKARIKQKVASFEYEVRAFSSVRDAIVLTTFRDVFSKPDLIDQYIAQLLDEEPDDDLRKFRIGIFQAVASVH